MCDVGFLEDGCVPHGLLAVTAMVELFKHNSIGFAVLVHVVLAIWTYVLS